MKKEFDVNEAVVKTREYETRKLEEARVAREAKMAAGMTLDDLIEEAIGPMMEIRHHEHRDEQNGRYSEDTDIDWADNGDMDATEIMERLCDEGYDVIVAHDEYWFHWYIVASREPGQTQGSLPDGIAEVIACYKRHLDDPPIVAGWVPVRR